MFRVVAKELLGVARVFRVFVKVLLGGSLCFVSIISLLIEYAFHSCSE